MVLTSDLIRDLWGTPSELARVAGVSRQSVFYWVREGFTLCASGRLDDTRGRAVRILPTCAAVVDYVSGTVRRLPDHFETSPAELAGHYAKFLPLAIGGRLVNDRAPIRVWREALQC